MAEPAVVTPATENVPSVCHNAQPSPHVSPSHSASSDTAAPKYERYGGTSPGTTAHSIVADEKAKVSMTDTKQPPSTEQGETVTSPTVITPVQAQPGTSSEAQAAHDRVATAESNMSQAAKVKLSKAEKKEAKQMSQLLEKEQKEQDQALKHLLKELSKLQAVNKSAIRAESKATSKHSKAVKQEHKSHGKFISAQGNHEKAAAELQTRTERLAKEKEHAATQASLLEQKTKEVEEFRQKKAVADRERQAKIQGLLQNPTGV